MSTRMQRGRGVLKCKAVDQGSVPEVVFLGGSLNTPGQAFPKWAGTPGGITPEGTHPSVNNTVFEGRVFKGPVTPAPVETEP